MQDPRLSKYQDVKNLGVKTFQNIWNNKGIKSKELYDDLGDSEIQGSILKSWVNLVKKEKKIVKVN
ncbi:hypothetical protein [Borrelia duttonii]|nr:hypothetical protein [Borrelia duttonii]